MALGSLQRCVRLERCGPITQRGGKGRGGPLIYFTVMHCWAWRLRKLLLKSVMLVRSGTPLGSGTAPTARVRLGRPWEVYNNVVTRDREAFELQGPHVHGLRVRSKSFCVCKPPEVADGDVHHLCEPAVTTATRCSTTMSSEDAPSATVATDHRLGRPSTLLWTIWRNTFLPFLIISLCCGW